MDLTQEIEKIWEAVNQMQNNPTISDHFHNGYDVSPINFATIYQKKLWVQETIQGANAATSTNYGTFWIAPFNCLVNSVYEIHQTAGTDGGAVTLQVEKLTGTTAAGSGSSMLSTALSLKATANTLQTGVLVPTAVSPTFKTLAKGDRLAMKLAGTPTSLSNVNLLIEIINVLMSLYKK